MTHTQLIERLRKAEGPDREIDMDLGKSLGLIPPEATWKPTDQNDLGSIIWSGQNREWELPAYSAAQADWTARMKAYIGSEEYYADKTGRWMTENPPPHHNMDWKDAPPAGHVPSWTASIDAALSLVSRVLPGAQVGLDPIFFVDPEAVKWDAILCIAHVDKWTPVNTDWIERIEARHPNRVLAILIAALTALQARSKE